MSQARHSSGSGLWATGKALVLLAFLGLAFVGLRYTGAGELLGRERLQTVVAAFGIWGPAVHMAIYALGGTVLLPATLFILLGAVLFGKVWGTLYNVGGAVAGAALSFQLARLLGRDAVSGWLSGRLERLDARAETHGFVLMLYLRLAYLPFAPLNYAAGLTRMRFRDYLAGTTLGILPATIIFTCFLDDLTGLRSWYDLATPAPIFSLVLFAASWSLPVILKRLAPSLWAPAIAPGVAPVPRLAGEGLASPERGLDMGVSSLDGRGDLE
jgi:uncharacterized membrane protein YdjX (TVP38/TMEM64 family)